jgi:hypothetical protein
MVETLTDSSIGVSVGSLVAVGKMGVSLGLVVSVGDKPSVNVIVQALDRKTGCSAIRSIRV